MHLLNFDTSSTVKNQIYLNANTANVNNQFCYTSFAARTNDKVFCGCLWVRFTNSISSSVPAIIASIGESLTTGSVHQYIAVITSSAGKVRFIIGTGTINADASVTAAHEIQTDEQTFSLNQWHKVRFHYTSDLADPTQNRLTFNNNTTVLSLRNGAPVSTVYTFSICRLFQHAIPANTRLASVWLHIGTLAEGTFDTFGFGLKSPLWLGDAGARSSGARPATVYMHGCRKVFENSVNDAAFAENGGAFTTLVQATNRTDFVRIA